MCGIMGYVRTASSKTRKRLLLEELMRGIETRGRHAAGAGCIGVDHNVWGRTPGTAHEFVGGQWWARMMQANPRLLIGHARHATHGSPKINKNNHPFVSDNGRWMLVHNGIIHDEVALEVPPRGECDSEIILRLLDERGFDETVAVMSRFNASYYACLALDTVERKLYAWRNQQAPLVVADLTEQIGGIVLVSTDNILRASMIRAGLSTEGVKVYDLRAGYRYWFPVNCAGGGLDDLPLDPIKGFSWEGIRKGYFKAPDGSEGGVDDGVPTGDGEQSLVDYYKNYPLGDYEEKEPQDA